MLIRGRLSPASRVRPRPPRLTCRPTFVPILPYIPVAESPWVKTVPTASVPKPGFTRQSRFLTKYMVRSGRFFHLPLYPSSRKLLKGWLRKMTRCFKASSTCSCSNEKLFLLLSSRSQSMACVPSKHCNFTGLLTGTQADLPGLK